MVTLAETARSGAQRATSRSVASLWRMGMLERMAMAAGAAVVLWSAIALGLS